MGPRPLSSVPFWKRINRLRKNSKNKNVGTLEVNGTKLTSDADKANAMADKLEQTFKTKITTTLTTINTQ